MWNCLWGNSLKRSPWIIRKSRVSYPCPGFLSSATWPSLPKKHYNGLNQTKPLFLIMFFFCLFGCNIAFKHIAKVPTCSSDTVTNVLLNTQKCHAADKGHDTQPSHSIQTRGRPVAVLYIDVERHTGIHNIHFNVLVQTRSGKTSSTFHTHQRTLHYMMLVWW